MDTSIHFNRNARGKREKNGTKLINAFMIQSNQKHKSRNVSRETSRRKRGSKKRSARGKRVLLAVLLLLAALNVVSLVAATVRTRTAEVTITDLPPSFDGFRILYISNPNVSTLNGLGRFRRMCGQLSALHPNAVVVTGALRAQNPLSGLLNPDFSDMEFYKELAGCLDQLQTPNAWIVRGSADADQPALAQALAESTVKPLCGSGTRIEIGGDALYIAGAAPDENDQNELARQFQRDDCVLCFSERSDIRQALEICEAADGGRWFDLLCTGPGTPGRLLIAEHTFEYQKGSGASPGWYDETYPILVSTGTAAGIFQRSPLSRAEVWLLTLRRP